MTSKHQFDRVEVITIEGRVLVKYGKFTISEQDGGKTLKVIEKGCSQ